MMLQHYVKDELDSTALKHKRYNAVHVVWQEGRKKCAESVVSDFRKRPTQDSNLESSAPEADALSIRPAGHGTSQFVIQL